MRLKKWIKRNYWILALIAIFLLAYWIRSFNIIPDKILGFDPTFQYRFTKYIVDWGHLPAWDELTYYVGRSDKDLVAPFMLYLTAFIFSIVKNFGFSLLTTASYMSAIYGALLVIPAYFLVKRLAGKKAGLLSAFLIGTAPQVMIRTFGGSYDTDQMALLFILVNLYFGLRFLQNKTIANFCWFTIGLGISMFAWALSIYSFLLLAASSALYFILQILFSESIEKASITSRLTKTFSEYKKELFGLVAVLATISIIGYLTKLDPIGYIMTIIGFASNPERWIVNISIAELQPFNIFNLEGWMLSTGRFVIGDGLIDTLLFIIMSCFAIAGILYNYKKDNRKFSFLITLFILAIYTTFRGIRFTEFSSVLFLVLIASGFGYMIKYVKTDTSKAIIIGSGIFLAFVGLSIGIQYGQQLGPGQNPNWETAWMFLNTQTPELSIVGTWWDPGHMIAALAERRNYADGAHCSYCMYTINDRITDLGKIMATDNETESLELIKKYKGTSPAVYWIASDDLIAKFQWLQYFGTGCDARRETRCPLYQFLDQQNILHTPTGQIAVREYGPVLLLPGIDVAVPIYKEGGNGYIFEEIISYGPDGKVSAIKLSENDTAGLIEALKPAESQLGFKFSDQILPTTIWIQKDFAYVVVIPPTLRESIFTKMFFLEGEGLGNFSQVFRNEQVKIYEVNV